MEEKKKKKESQKLGKFTKIAAILASILVILPCLAVAVFGILDIALVFPFLTNEVRSYHVSFVSQDEVIFNKTYKRVEILDRNEITTPTNVDGKFIGWDFNNDKIPDLLPHRVYSNISAKAIWTNVKVSESESEVL